MSYKKGSWGIKKQKQRYNQFRKSMPRAMGTIAINHYKSGFIKGGGTTDDNIGGWQKRKANRGLGRAILVKTGDLKRSIRILHRTVSRGIMSVKIGTAGIVYAAVHNFGLKAGRGKGFIMPKREFIGDSRIMDKKMMNMISRRLNKVFKK